ncbi:hypothetical protein BS50DRAFT_508298 [Corynespora cassiicola Philippines]|uniref:Cell surface spherulin 4-like protein n=1 Tax=Corynespora cassiicola Philippines TaxID=1448308 RepID=A0A2T2N238_CORCC|nr:hypothetical protein BS50DRAFT_508298 [Corynespora cassiicola Philippines]
MSIILPLYVYPTAGAWNPLYEAARKYDDVEFNVIVNPCSGPCVGSLPDQIYLDEIPKLRTFDNIRTLGYVATNYTTKSIDNVLKEIDAYANWPKTANNTKLKVDGIFFDETPSTYNVGQYEYLKKASQAVKNGTRFRDRFVVHNPGLISPALLASRNFTTYSYLNLSDITVVFEETFSKWLDASTFDALHSHKLPTSQLAVILHSLPNLSKRVLDFVVQQVEETADWLFLTNVGVKDEYYHGFSPIFENLVKAVDGGAE